MKGRISDGLKIYASYVKVAEAHLALAEEISSKSRDYYNSIKDKMQKWIYNILDIFKSQMLRKGKAHYVPLINVLRENVTGRFERIDNLEGFVK